MQCFCIQGAGEWCKTDAGSSAVLEQAKQIGFDIVEHSRISWNI